MNEGLEELLPEVRAEDYIVLLFNLKVLRLSTTLKNIGQGIVSQFARNMRIYFPQGVLYANCNAGFIGLNNRWQSKLLVYNDVIELERNELFSQLYVSLVEFEEGSKLEKIGAEALASTSITSFTAPESLREIGPMAFFACGRLSKICLNDNLERIGEQCFFGTKIYA